jgi:CubicO group peptidase (beta-lactamase class C family)
MSRGVPEHYNVEMMVYQAWTSMRQFRRTLAAVGLFMALGQVACSAYQDKEQDRDLPQALVGTWREYLVFKGTPNFTALHRFRLDDDGDPIEVLKYEYGVQSRIWSGLKDVSVSGGRIDLYGEFEGSFSAGRDSIFLEYPTRDGTTLDFVLVRSRDDAEHAFMDSLESCRLTPYVYLAPEPTGDGIACGSLEAIGIADAKILELMERIRKGHYRDFHSLLVIKNDTLVLEEYFGGRGQVHGPFLTRHAREKIHQLASCTKSVNSTLIGIARDKGMIPSLDVSVSTYFPDYPALDEGTKSTVTIRDLLTMSAGFEWNELSVSYEDRDNDVNLMWQSQDPLAYLFDKPMVETPGIVFNYNSSGSTALGEILRRASGMAVDSFAVKELFEPMGIDQFEWTRHLSGLVSTGGGLSLRSRDLAKIGLLFLHRGQWNGTQIVSEEWISEATSAKVRTPSGHYGYQWWIREYATSAKAYTAIGLGGNFLTVFPDRNLIVVATAQDFDDGWSRRYSTILEKYILPSFK